MIREPFTNLGSIANEPGERREPWHTLYTAEELAVALEYIATRHLAKAGFTLQASEMMLAAEALREFHALRCG